MPIINYTTREIEFKIVYYGPAFAGKTTNLKAIHSRLSTLDPMITLQTGADRTLFFDFVAARVGLIEGFQTRFGLYTVPGAVVLNVPRQLVLRDVDGIVFVADSQWARMEDNVVCMSNLEENLHRHGRRLDDVPLVLQYNKRDLAHIGTVNYLDFLLNNGERPRHVFEAVARRGGNVFECLDALTGLILSEFQRQRGHENPGREFQLHEDH